MTSTPPPFDELVSAYLDGEATAEEVARVERTPELMAEVDRLRSLTSRFADTSAVPDPSPAMRDTHIAAALAEFDIDLRHASSERTEEQPVETEQSPAATAPVVSLQDRRERKRLFGGGQALGIAAAVAFLMLGAAALFSFGGVQPQLETAETALRDTSSAWAASSTDAMAEEADDAVESALSLEAGSKARTGSLDLAAAASDSPMDDDAAAEPEAMADYLADEEAADEEAMDEPAAEAPAPMPTRAALQHVKTIVIAAEECPADSLGGVGNDVDGNEDTPTDVGGVDVSETVTFCILGTDNAQSAANAVIVGVPAEVRTLCQSQNPSLNAFGDPTLLRAMVVDNTSVEIHQMPGTNSLLLLDATTCEILDVRPLED